jgi:spore germination protein YaaH
VKLLSGCLDCQTTTNDKTAETTVSYADKETGSYHLTYYSDENSFKEKMALVKKYNLGGVAFWALGYESENYLSPFKSLKKYSWQDELKLF